MGADVGSPTDFFIRVIREIRGYTQIEDSGGLIFYE